MSDGEQQMDYENSSTEHLHTWHRVISILKSGGILIAIALLILLVLYFN